MKPANRKHDSADVHRVEAQAGANVHRVEA